MNNLLYIVLAAQGQEGGGNPYSFPIMMGLLILVFYFFMIRPQMRKQKEVRNFREGLQKGDKVVTVGGIYGKITEISDTTVMLDIGNSLKIKVDKNGLVKDSSEIPPQK